VKRTLAVLAASVALVVAGTPARAEVVQGVHCLPYFNNPGTRAVQVCVSVVHDTINGNVVYWVRASYNHIAGYQNPYDLDFVDVHHWSQSGGSGVCDGNASKGCDGDGNITDDTIASIPATRNTNHLGQSAHYCTDWGETSGYITWNVGGGIEPFDVNSQNVPSAPWCR